VAIAIANTIQTGQNVAKVPLEAHSDLMIGKSGAACTATRRKDGTRSAQCNGAGWIFVRRD